MFDLEARRVIEALRSGVPSRAVGRYFTEARPQIMKTMSDALVDLKDERKSGGKIIIGKYGEGKTHLLNTVFNMAHDENMVVSFLSLSKETPMDKLYLIYKKTIENTYLPKREQPGFTYKLDEISMNSPVANAMMLYATRELQTDKLYYLLKAYLGTEDAEEKFQMKSDLEGDFMANPVLKKIYKRIYNETARFKANFSKTKHTLDYFSFMSELFLKLGYNGWVILFDEAELMGRLGKKARLKAYRNMDYFLNPQSYGLHSVFSVFALSSSYNEDVIEGKHEFENLAEVYPDDQEPMKSVLQAMQDAQQLQPLTKKEIGEVVSRIMDFHFKAYDWQADIDLDDLMRVTESGGFLLRTKLRSAIEYLDQIYQYGTPGSTKTGSLETESYKEDSETPSLDALMQKG